jgi:serine/threonine-protein kinase
MNEPDRLEPEPEPLDEEDFDWPLPASSADPVISDKAATPRAPQQPTALPLSSLLSVEKGSILILPFVACVVMASVVYILWDHYAPATSATVAAPNGTTIIDSRPQGLEVVIDEEARGKTPVKLVLPLGNHTLKIQTNAETRSIPLSIEAGTITSQFVDFGQSAQKTGRLLVEGAQGSVVRLDGAVVGTSPLTLADVTAGEHKVVVGTGDSAITRGVTILPGATTSIVAAVSPPSPTAGWVSFKAPFELQVFEAERLVGTTSMERIMLPPGAHRFELVNAPLEFRTTTSVQVVAGSTATANIAIPNGLLSVNALPWAEVEIDGKPVGTTPLANISLSIGSHRVVWRHPQLGERERTVAITATAPARVGVDFGQ